MAKKIKQGQKEKEKNERQKEVREDKVVRKENEKENK